MKAIGRKRKRSLTPNDHLTKWKINLLFIEKRTDTWLSRSGVNFTNILRAAFKLEDPISALKLLNLTFFFLRFWDLRAQKLLVECWWYRPLIVSIEVFCYWGKAQNRRERQERRRESILQNRAKNCWTNEAVNFSLGTWLN